MIGQASEDILILTIESSCDGTAATAMRSGRTILPNAISSQIITHTVYGGVVPETTPREHIKTVNYVIERVLTEAQVALEDITAVGMTYGPDLIDALLVGVAEAKAVAYAAGKPLIGVHYIEGRTSANLIENQGLEPPFVCFIVSGSHAHLAIIGDCREFEIIGRTRDGVAGEVFDKAARSVDLGCPGGSEIDKAAKEGDSHVIQFPRGKVEGTPYDFGFSGLESVVLSHINHARMTGEETNVPDLVASFQNSVAELLVSYTMLAAHEFGYKKLVTTDGVVFNSALRKTMAEACEKDGTQFYYLPLIFCTDNAAMVGTVAYYECLKGNISGWGLNVAPNLKLGECQSLSEI